MDRKGVELPRCAATVKARNSRDHLIFLLPRQGARRGMSVESFVAEMELELYPQDVSYELVKLHVSKLLAEKLLMPNAEDLWIGKDGQLDPNYLGMMQRAVDFWQAKGDKLAVKRFTSELEGAKNIVRLVTESAQRGERPPTVVSASDPGDFYVDQDGRKKSVTFVSILLGADEGGWRYRQVVIPTRYIGLVKHWEILQTVGEVEKTEKVLGTAVETLSAEALIAFPVLLQENILAIDKLAQELGYSDWDEVEEKARDQLVLAEDTLATGRREAMITKFAELICQYVRENRTESELKALANAMGDTFALEQGKVYLGWDGDQISLQIDKTVQVARVDAQRQARPLDRATLFLTEAEAYELEQHQAWMMQQFATNELAREARSTGCGGSGISGISLFGRGEANLSTMQYQLGWSGDPTWQTESPTSGSTGKYKEFYDYKPGVCAHCHESKPYVAHPKSENIKCAGWCSDCEK